MANPCVIIKLGETSSVSTADLSEKLLSGIDKKDCIRDIINHLEGIASGCDAYNQELTAFVSSEDFDPKESETYANFSGTVVIEGGVGTVTGSADDEGVAGNVELVGDGVSTVTQLGVASGEDLTFSAGGSLIPELNESIQFAGGLDIAAAEATLDLTTDIVLTSVSEGSARNTQTFTIEVEAAAANPTNTVLVAFTGPAGAIVCTVTPNDGTNNTATPVDLTTEELVELINTGVVVGKTITLTDASSRRVLQTATGGDTTPLANAGEGDGVVGTFAGGVNAAAATFNSAAVNLVNTSSTVTIVADESGAQSNTVLTGDSTNTVNQLIALESEAYTVSAGGTRIPFLGETITIAGGLDDVSSYVVKSVTF